MQRQRKFDGTPLVFIVTIMFATVLFSMNISQRMVVKVPTSAPQLNTTQQQQHHHSSPLLRKFALMTEPRCLNATLFVLENALEKLAQDVKVVLLHSTDNSECVAQWIQNSTILSQANSTKRLVHYVEPNMNVGKNYRVPHHSGYHWLSTMYTNVSFWQSLKGFGDAVLTIQTDTLICSNQSPDWNVNYIGGISAGRPTNDWPLHEINTHHLNGGLSIRNIDWMISCLDNNTHSKALAEDAVFNTCDNGNVTIEEAMAFASDNGRTMCFTDSSGKRRCPWGVHKPWSSRVGWGPPIQELVAYCDADIQKLAVLLGDNFSISKGLQCKDNRCL